MYMKFFDKHCDISCNSVWFLADESRVHCHGKSLLPSSIIENIPKRLHTWTAKHHYLIQLDYGRNSTRFI